MEGLLRTESRTKGEKVTVEQRVWRRTFQAEGTTCVKGSKSNELKGIKEQKGDQCGGGAGSEASGLLMGIPRSHEESIF